MLDYAEYTIDGDGYQDNGNGYHGNGYDQLDGDWLAYYKVAKGFTHKVKPEDREDFLHDLFLAFSRVKAGYDRKGRELTEGGLVRIAQYQVSDYWRAYFNRVNGIDCGHCGKAQRAKCKRDNSYGGKCPKAVQFESLSKLVEGGEGNKVELYQLLADDNTDFTDRLDARLILEGYPRRFVELAYKKCAGYQLTESERSYYRRELKKAQRTLV
jgi:hypothetical protein